MCIVKLHTILLMNKYYNDRLPKAFNDFFSLVKHKHQYNTRFASKATYTLQLIRTNHGLNNICFYGPKLWNSVDEELKSLSVSTIISKLQLRFTSEYYSTELLKQLNLCSPYIYAVIFFLLFLRRLLYHTNQ